MDFKYLDSTNTLINIIGLNLSVLGILFSLKYKVDARVIKLLGNKIIIKNTKIPLLILVFNSFVISLCFVAELRNCSFQNYSIVFKQFGRVLFSVMVVSIICVLIAYKWIIQYNAIICDSNESVEKYLQFTSDVKTNSDILIVGGDLSFLGYLPDYNYGFCSNGCSKILSAFNHTMQFPEVVNKDCPFMEKCMLHNAQLKQLHEKLMINKIRIRILCNKPNDNSLIDKKYRLTIAELYNIFKENLEIRFYIDNCQELPMKGRLKTSNDGTREFFWQWKSDSDVFLFPEKWVDNTAIGKTIIHLYDVLLWNQCAIIDSTCVSKYKTELLQYMESLEAPIE